MNAQHVINRIDNRVKRLLRQVHDLSMRKLIEERSAFNDHRQPVLDRILPRIAILERRLRQLGVE